MTMPTREVPIGLTAEQAAIVASQAAYEAQQQALRQQLAAAVIALWAGVAQGGAFNPFEAAKWVERILPISLGAQRAMTAITVAQLNQMVSPPEPIIVSPATTTGAVIRNGAPPERYYERPFTEIRWQLSRGKTVEQAVAAGQRRAMSIAQTDVQLAHTYTARRFIQETRRPDRRPGPRGRIVGSRRVLSSNPNHCALCILASTQTYSVKTLMPIHPGCGCRVVPVYENDPGAYDHVNDPDLLENVHEAIRRDLGESYVDRGGRRGDALYRNIVIVRNHGELGPVLGVRDHDFTGPRDVPRLDHQRINPLPGNTDEDVQNLDEL